MYPANTILKRTEPFPPVTEQELNEDGKLVDVKHPNPLNKLRIVAVSPVNATAVESWNGGTGNFLIVAPYERFGANQVAPESVLNSEYEVVEYGEDSAPRKIELDSPAHKRMAMRTPEQQFADSAREQAKRAKSEAKDASKTSTKTQNAGSNVTA